MNIPLFEDTLNDDKPVIDDYFDLKNVVSRHRKHLQKLANIYAEVQDMRDDFKAVSEHYQDNGDTAADADRVLLAMGSLLADLITYTNEYAEEEERKCQKTKT